MNVMTQQDQQFAKDPVKYIDDRQKLINALLHLWSSTIVDHLPTPENFAGWLDSFGPQITAEAIRKTANKARKEMRAHCPMDCSDLERYCTGTARRIAVERGIWK